MDTETLWWRALNSLTEHVVIVDGDGTVLAANRSWQGHRSERGLAGGDAVGRRFSDAFLEPLGVAAEAAERIVSGLGAVLNRSVPRFGCEYHVRSPLRLQWFALNVTAMPGQNHGAVILQRDITQQKALEFDLIERSNHDGLTGLANRRFFLLEGELMVALAKRQGWHLTLVYLDLNGFKAINDHYGHDLGDVVLQRVAARLRGQTRASDLLARIGGDEFVMLLGNVSPADSMRLVRQYRKSLAHPPLIAGTSIALRGAFGLAHYPDHGTTLTELLLHADKAMYDAKTSPARRHRQSPTEPGAGVGADS